MKKTKDKIVFRVIIAISILVFLLVVILNRRILPVPVEIPSFAYHLPFFHALINGTTSALLILSFYFIAVKKNIVLHRKINITAFILSVIFIVSYVTYHYLLPETKYGGEGIGKTIYYTILISHIVLAAVVLPFILWSFYLGLSNQVAKHRKVAKYTWFVWFYVAITGVVIYVMISPYYNFS